MPVDLYDLEQDLRTLDLQLVIELRVIEHNLDLMLQLLHYLLRDIQGRGLDLLQLHPFDFHILTDVLGDRDDVDEVVEGEEGHLADHRVLLYQLVSQILHQLSVPDQLQEGLVVLG